ncbi:MAG: hypothetical protein SFV81_17290 [Pirellulaceae bacterium]|nr:hypothetical protein [Pirellulaceae bacterium]
MLNRYSPILPQSVIAFARKRGYVELPNAGVIGVFCVLRKPGNTARVLIPLDRSLDDYAARCHDAVERLAAIENVSELQIIDAVMNDAVMNSDGSSNSLQGESDRTWVAQQKVSAATVGDKLLLFAKVVLPFLPVVVLYAAAKLQTEANESVFQIFAFVFVLAFVVNQLYVGIVEQKMTTRLENLMREYETRHQFELSKNFEFFEREIREVKKSNSGTQ